MLRTKDDNAYLDENAEYDRIASEDKKSYFATNWDNCKDMWVRYRCNTFLNLGNNTNNRVESYNEKIKGILNNNDKLHTAVRGLLLLHSVKMSQVDHERFLSSTSRYYSY